MSKGRKRNRKAILITAAVMLLGVLLVLAGLFGGSVAGLFVKDFDYRNINPEDLGSSIEADMKVIYDDIDLPDKTLQIVGDIQSDDYRLILLDLSALSLEDQRAYYASMGQHITVSGTLRAVDENEFTEVCESIYRLYDHVYYERDREITLEQFREFVIQPVIPYCIEVTSIRSFNWLAFIPAGIFIFIVSLVLMICLVFKLRKRIVLPVVYGLMVIITGILFLNHIRTMLSVHKVADGLYTMKNIECTDTQGMLDCGATNVNELVGWILDNHLYGAPNFFADTDLEYGCSAFAAESPEGEHLFGRNFDLFETDILLVHSHPEGAYESIAIADLAVVGVGENAAMSPDSFFGRAVMIMTPYVVVDGMNEAGVGVGILQLNIEETHQDQGKPDLLVFCAIRAILDNCASVDEAIALLDSYDIQSDMEADYHLFITDRSGRYVVVEWLGGEMTVVEHPCCTNSVVAPGEYYDMGLPDGRMSTIEERLGPDRVVTAEEAMAILRAVQNDQGLTEWSCVYNLDDFTVSICLDADYETVYTFGPEDLR
ncbi:MAG: linear amide C-N hydrolase [Clostridiales bacterium]|nr:linear amide C-N hydrolase [Clostridiales bacterium]